MAEYIEHTCGECIHSNICERLPTLTGWDVLNPAYCSAFMNAADVAPVVHGRWHDIYMLTPWVCSGVCSNCDTKSYMNSNFPFANYCPNCGAKMDSKGGNDAN